MKLFHFIVYLQQTFNYNLYKIKNFFVSKETSGHHLKLLSSFLMLPSSILQNRLGEIVLSRFWPKWASLANSPFRLSFKHAHFLWREACFSQDRSRGLSTLKMRNAKHKKTGRARLRRRPCFSNKNNHCIY